MNQLEKKLDYQFNNIKLLNTALRHRSLGKQSNERMEFLGDSILSFVIADELYRKYPKFSEGDLSRFRSNLVKKDTLAVLAKEFELGDYIQLGIGEMRSGGFRRASILADTMEAIVGAVYLDSNIKICREKILQWYGDRINNLKLTGQKDAKTELQEYLQANKLPLPNYKIMKTTGKAHDQVFHMRCTVKGLDISTEGKGANKQAAEQVAARKFLKKIK